MISLKVVCFDLDGTICDLWKGEYRAKDILIGKLEEEFGKTVEHVTGIYNEEWAKIKLRYMTHVVDGLDELDIREMHIVKVFKRLGINGDPRSYADLHCRETMKGIYVYPDAEKVLRVLGERYRLTMITNGASMWQREKIEKLGIEKHFEEIIVSGELGHHKPSPRIFKEMTDRTRVSPSEIIYIGNDYRKDIQGAKDSGWNTAWVKRTDEIRDESMPDYTIKELSELLGILR